MDVKCIQFFINLFESARRLPVNLFDYGVCRGYSYNYCLHQDLLNCQTAQYQIQSIQINQVEQTSEMARFTKLVHSAVSFFYVYILLLACYLPLLICMRIKTPSVARKRFLVVSVTFLFINSSLNPIIYCWRMRNMRHSIINLLRNMSRNRNRILHSSLVWLCFIKNPYISCYRCWQLLTFIPRLKKTYELSWVDATRTFLT